jgi:hypothetical protein
MNRRSILKIAASSAAVSGAGSVGLASAETQRTPQSPEAPSSESRTISVRAFGAKGDGKADDTRAIQEAIVSALRTRTPTVHLPAGTYRTTDTLHLGYGETFATISLVGEATYSYAGMAGVMILPEATDRPAINVQGARGNVIQGISIQGRNHRHIGRKIAEDSGAADAEPQGWLDQDIVGGLRRHAPYAAITIDAFSGPPPIDGYPAPTLPPWLGPQGSRARNYSSDIVIDRCWLGGFGVAIAVQPGDSDGNGDFVKVSRSHIEHCVYGIAVGNAQSRNVAIRDCTYVGVHTFITNKHFGRGIGTLGGPIDNVSGGRSYQLMDIAASRSLPITVSHLYVEAQSRIGSCSVNSGFNNPVIFQSCIFDFNESLLGASPAALLECGMRSAVRFVGCTFHQARRIMHLVKGADFVGIESCMFGLVSDWLGNDFYRDIPEYMAKALNYTCGGVFLHGSALRRQIALTGGTVGLAFDPENHVRSSATRSSTLVPPAGGRVVVHHYAREIVDRFGRIWPIRHRPEPFPLAKQPHSGGLRTLAYVGPDEIQVGADSRLLSSLQSRLQPGDILYDSESGTIFAVSRVANRDIVEVQATQLNNLTMFGGQVATAADITSSPGYLWLYHGTTMVGDTVFFGDYAAASTKVTNVHSGARSAAGLARCLLPGDVLHHSVSGPPLPGSDQPQPYPPMTTVVAVDEAAGTVTLDRPATFTTRHLVSTVALG